MLAGRDIGALFLDVSAVLAFLEKNGEVVGAPLICLLPEIDEFEPMHAWLLEWLVKASDEEKCVIMRSYYELWMARNNEIEAERLEDPTVVKDRVLRLLE